jgi:hypothetical protein
LNFVKGNLFNTQTQIVHVNNLGPISDQFPKNLTFSEFSRENRENFVIAHINCHHLHPHSMEMRIKFENSCVDVVGVNETFLRDSVSSRSLAIKGYNFVRNDRTVRGGPGVGGVGLYIRSELGFKVKKAASSFCLMILCCTIGWFL